MVTQVLLNVAVLSLQAQSSEFKLQFYQKKKKRYKCGCTVVEFQLKNYKTSVVS
jgi:hypothetical protein